MLKSIEKYRTVTGPIPIFQDTVDNTYRARVNEQNILATDLDDIKNAIDQAVMHKVTSKWTPMIMIRMEGNQITLDVRYLGVINTTGISDQYVISDILKDSEDVSTWRPSLHYSPWSNDGTYKLIPYSMERLMSIEAIESALVSFRKNILDELFGESGTLLLDAIQKDKTVLKDYVD